MALFPYRVAAPRLPDPGPEPVSEAARLGPRRSVHAPPPLGRALVGPIVIAALVLGVGVVLDALGALGESAAATRIVLPFAVAVLVLLTWSPIRRRGLQIEVHTRGLVVSRPGSREVIVFADVDEVWFDIDRLHTTEGAFLRGLRLVEHEGAKRRLPLEVNDAHVIVKAVLHACSESLLHDVRCAIAAGDALTFGPVVLDRHGITIAGARASWRDLRLVRLQPARVTLFRRMPLLPWRTVRLDRVPHPTVLARLIAERSPHVKRDERLMTPD